MHKKYNEPFIFMKIGSHAGETFDKIFKRKMEEYRKTGMMFWGYGGVACHPLNQVQPFVNLYLKKYKSLYLIMQSVKSNADQDQYRANEYSKDGINWEPVPKDINVLGSRYALVLEEIKPFALNLDISKYDVAVGPSRGKNASEYLRGRTDKACLVPNVLSEDDVDKNIKPISFKAKLKDPYAVLLR